MVCSINSIYLDTLNYNNIYNIITLYISRLYLLKSGLNFDYFGKNKLCVWIFKKNVSHIIFY